MNHILIAKLKHKITFLERKESEAFAEEKWEEKFQTYAEIIPLDENSYNYIENLNFGQIISESLFIFHIRYISLPLSKLRIKYNDRLFEIKKVTNKEEKNFLLSIIALEIN
ncbi:MAG: hypothetical protein K0R02_930 [Rickettsiaceae bacterium]|jgi:SPP1 family predicted phage head-tail adaptor|nr:hypothetical protein [Rickettsiaceae bacterium]